jgi:DNA-binding CsgD family transcriptional regulator
MRSTSPVVVGRRDELALMYGALDRVRDGGGCVFLVGEAGSGKSRLVGDCVYRGHQGGVRVLRGRGSPIGTTTPFRPLVEALSSYLRNHPVPRHDDLDPYRPALARLIPEWRVPGQSDPVPSLVEMSEALLRLLGTLGRDRGTLVVLEDLHDADLETIAVVEYLVDNLTHLPVLVAATLRPEPGPALDLVNAAAQRRAATVIPLPPLAADEVRALAAGYLDTTPEGVPQAAVTRLVHDGAGNPYLLEELLADMVESGGLVPDPDGWRATDRLGGTVPRSIVESFRRRVGRLGSGVQDLLNAAAVLGHRFPLPVVAQVTGFDDRTLLRHLRTATQAYLVVPDGSGPDWYAFRHAVTAEAILAALLPGEQAAIARRAAQAIEAADPELTGERCQLVAALRVMAGETACAAGHYARAGRRALAAGATASAEALLERGFDLARGEARADIFELLVGALAENHRLDRALELMAGPGAALPAAPDRRVSLHTTLAWAAVVAGRTGDAGVQVAAARAALPADPAEELTTALLVVEAHLAFLADGPDVEARRAEAEWRAQMAADQAERIPMPVVACQALQLLALLARERGFAEADRCLERMLAVAETHEVPTWRVEALLRLGVNDFMRTASVERLHQARAAAFALGALVLAHTAEDSLAMNAVLCGDDATARGIIEGRLGDSPQANHLGDHQYLMVTSAALAAHHGRRAEMETALAAVTAASGGTSLLTPLALGLCRAVCALLEEDRALATTELDALLRWETQNPGVYYLAGQYGLLPLLRTLTGDSGWTEYEKIMATSAARLRWNAHFLQLTAAVLYGRDGRDADAADAVRVAQDLAAPFPMARALGLRLVSEAALADGWGEPTRWLRTAEDYFHSADVSAVAGACRALLRQAGARITQRRDGSEQIPSALRDRGVTIREYEVFALLSRRPGNKTIGQRLFISPRTVEKHVASLIVKTGRANRSELCDYAEELTIARESP